MLRLRCLPLSPRSAPSPKLSLLYVAVSPVSRAERCKPCPAVLVPTLGCSRPLPPGLLLLASALSGSMIPGICLFVQVKTVLTFGHVYLPPQEKNKHTGSCTPPDAFAPASTSGRESAGRFTLVCTHAHAPTSRSGAETAPGRRTPKPRTNPIHMCTAATYVAASCCAAAAEVKIVWALLLLLLCCC